MSAAVKTEKKPTVCVVDGDVLVGKRLQGLLAGLGVTVKVYPSAEAFLNDPPGPPSVCCLITEIDLPGMSGLELMSVLHQRDQVLPTIVLAGASDVPTAVRAMQLGALDFIDKPFVDRLLLTRVRQVMERARQNLPPP